MEQNRNPRRTPDQVVKSILAIIGFSAAIQLAGQEFYNVAFVQGIFVQVENAYVGCGASFYDINHDGWDDVTLCSPGNDLHIWLNNQGQLSPAPFSIPNSTEAKMPLWGDFDNDGDADLLVTKAYDSNRLYRNDGDSTFTDITSTSGLSMEVDARSYGAAWGDYDRDGWLDLYVCNYNFNGTISNELYRNNGDGTFAAVHENLGVSNEVRPSFQPVFTDFNRDLNPDIYVINDKNHPNALYQNMGNSTFTEVGAATGADLVIDAMSNAWTDFDHDGDLDCYVTNATAGNKFLVNDGNGQFSERADSLNLGVFSICWGALWTDYNNDGWEDLYVLTTFNGFAGNQNYFYRNDAGSFTEDLISTGIISDYHSGYANCRGDLDRDGYPDMLVNCESPDYANLWQNSGGVNHFVRITLEGVASNRDGIGAWVTVHANGTPYSYYTRNGENYMGQNSQHRIVGLGSATVVDSVTVEWPSGITDVFGFLAVDQEYAFLEGSSWSAQIGTGTGAFQFCPGDSLLLTAPTLNEAIWQNGAVQDSVWVSEAGWYWAQGTLDNGLTIQTDSAWIAPFTWTPPTYLTTDVSCHGQLDGSVVFPEGFSVTATDSTQVWTSNLAPGTHTYLLEDGNGCRNTVSVDIVEPDSLSAAVSVSVPMPQWVVTAEPSGGVPPYSYLWSTGNTEMAFLTETPGPVSCWIIDANGCSTFATGQVAVPVGVPEAAGTAPRFFPSPTNQALTWGGPLHGHLRISDSRGRIVHDGPLDRRRFETSEWPVGTYHWQWIADQGHFNGRIVRIP